jgi:hypothetical protein
LKKNDEIGMPTAIKDVVNGIAELRQSKPDQIESLVQSNFSRLIADDPRFHEIQSTLLSSTDSRIVL